MDTVKYIGGGKSPLPSQSKERYGALDGLRTIACIGIVLMHIKSNILVSPTENWFTMNVISFTGNFVLLFMMVSAFSVSCGYYKKISNGDITTNEFYAKRYMRVLPFFALLVVLDILQTFATEGFSFTEMIKAELYESYADITLVFGLMPEADIKVIGVGWFLGIIFLFYMLYPFFTFLMHTKRRAWIVFALCLGLYYSIVEYFIPIKGVTESNTNILLCAPYFIVGGLVYLYKQDLTLLAEKKILGVRLPLWMMAVVVAYTVYFFALPTSRIRLFSNLTLYALWLLYAVLDSCSGKATFLNNKITAVFSGISMEIYLCHMMFFRVVDKIHLEKYISNYDLYYYVMCLFVLAGAVCFSMLWKRLEKKVLTMASSISFSR